MPLACCPSSCKSYIPALLVILGLFVWASPCLAEDMSKIDLWTQGTVLRGANIWQSKSYGVIEQVEGRHVGPAFTQADFDLLADLGANLVHISHTGLFDENGTPDLAAAENLDGLLDKIEAADMFAVIAFRTGPGRNEFTFVRDEAGDWFDESQLDERVISDPTLQAMWADMWRFTAERYQDNPIVVGYNLIVEPNANEILANGNEAYYSPETFYPEIRGTDADWNLWHRPLVAAIREVDPYTPILVGTESYAAAGWIAYLEAVRDERLVVDIHPYEPYEYVFQCMLGEMHWPGMTDLDWDGEDEMADGAWLLEFLADAHEYDQGIGPVAAMEYGAQRCSLDMDIYITDMIAALETYGFNHAVWAWFPEGYSQWGDEFLVRRSQDLNDHQDYTDTPLLRALAQSWSRNSLRPSNVTFVE